MNAAPLSRTPRRLTNVTITSTARQSGSVYGCKLGKTEISAPMPAEIPTATTST